MAGRLYNTPFVDLLPGSIATDPTIKAAAASLDGVLRTLTLSVPNLLLYSRLMLTAGRKATTNLLPALQRIIDARGGLQPLSTAELELLAWQFHVDFREVAKTDAHLAEMIVQSIPWHRIKGTPASIKRALGLFGYSADIEEGEQGKYWATYQLGLPQIADIPTVQHIVKICNEMAPVRCRLWRIYTDAYDRRPIILSHGPVLGSGWLSFYSGVPVPDAPGSEDDVIVSFGTRNAYQAEQAFPDPQCASFGMTQHMGSLAPYLDRFVLGRSRLSDVYPRNHGFVMSSLFSILWADRATTGRRWRGEWDARRWLDYTGFDRKLPPWRMGKRTISRAQLVPGWSDGLGDVNDRLGATFAVLIDNPMRLGVARLSDHDSQRRELRLHEMFVQRRACETPPVNPGVPRAAGAVLLSSFFPQREPCRVLSIQHLQLSMAVEPTERGIPCSATTLHMSTCCQPRPVAPPPATAITTYRAPLWVGAWSETGRTWRSETIVSVQ